MKIISEIEKNAIFFQKVSPYQYRTKCPLCGDSPKPTSGHLYLKCSDDPNEPILYFCFLCNKSGRVNKALLEKMNVEVSEMDQEKIFNRIPSIAKVKGELELGYPDITSLQFKYIVNRLGNGFTIDDLKRFRIVWDMSSLHPYISNIGTRNTLPSNLDSISFLSTNNSVLLTRFFSDENPRWRKTTLMQSEGRSFYTIKTDLDLFTKDTITVNIGEGVFDVLSAYKNFNNDPSVYISPLGSDYVSAVDYAIAKGIMGDNVVFKIYLDADIDERQIKFYLKKYSWIATKIILIKNIKAHDVGVTVDKIQLVEFKV